MERRTFLAGAAAALGTIAGCVGDAPETPDDGPATTDTRTDGSGGGSTDTPGDDPTETPGSSGLSIVSRSLEQRGDCGSPGTASISADGSTVTVEGCIAGRNGCTYPTLASATYDAGADELSVRVGTEDTSDPDEACTQAIVQRGYAVTVEFDGGLPGTTTVTHDGMDGEQQVAQSETDG